MDVNFFDTNSMINRAKIRVKEAEAELLRAKEWLRGLELEVAHKAKEKVSEGSSDSRSLLNG